MSDSEPECEHPACDEECNSSFACACACGKKARRCEDCARLYEYEFCSDCDSWMCDDCRAEQQELCSKCRKHPKPSSRKRKVEEKEEEEDEFDSIDILPEKKVKVEVEDESSLSDTESKSDSESSNGEYAGEICLMCKKQFTEDEEEEDFGEYPPQPVVCDECGTKGFLHDNMECFTDDAFCGECNLFYCKDCIQNVKNDMPFTECKECKKNFCDEHIIVYDCGCTVPESKVSACHGCFGEKMEKLECVNDKCENEKEFLCPSHAYVLKKKGDQRIPSMYDDDFKVVCDECEEEYKVPEGFELIKKFTKTLPKKSRKLLKKRHAGVYGVEVPCMASLT